MIDISEEKIRNLDRIIAKGKSRVETNNSVQLQYLELLEWVQDREIVNQVENTGVYSMEMIYENLNLHLRVKLARAFEYIGYEGNALYYREQAIPARKEARIIRETIDSDKIVGESRDGNHLSAKELSREMTRPKL